MKHGLSLGLLVCVLGLAGCATHLEGARYESVEPKFDLFAFFDGPVKAWGLVQGRDGELIQRFTVEIDGRLDGDRLVLDETFEYAIGDGPKTRTWVIEKQSDGGYFGSAGDILGTASGQSFGNAFNWQYVMDIPVGDRLITVQFDDWFWALDESRIFNRSYLQKFGFDVAEVTIFMERLQK